MLTLGLASGAIAETQWQTEHRRRHEVNHRLANRDARIHHEVKDGQMTKAPSALHEDDSEVRQEERDLASEGGRHISKQDQDTLHQQQSAVSKDIK